MPLDRPIPAFYCCYLLRSTVNRSSVYVGSTPNPVRRLRQHNGIAKGGAVRTSRPSLRPWEMSCIVTGFPSHIAALQFEWAWQNSHITTHIPTESRISHSAGKKRSGHPKRPRHSVSSLLSNLHLLLRVPTFSRWPLELRFFSEDVHKAWLKWDKSTPESIRDTINIILDFAPPKSEVSDPKESSNAKKRKISHGIQGLQVGYADSKPHVEKAKNIIDFEREGYCAICEESLEHGQGVYAVCPAPDCESVTHLTCLSQLFRGTDDNSLVPIQGNCPSCTATVRWIDVVKEVTLRMRGDKEVTQLMKVKRIRKGKAPASSQAIVDSSDDEESEEEDDQIEAELREMAGLGQGKDGEEIDDSESDTGSIASNATTASITSKKSPKKAKKPTKQLKAIIEDSDSDVEILSP